MKSQQHKNEHNNVQILWDIMYFMEWHVQLDHRLIDSELNKHTP